MKVLEESPTQQTRRVPPNPFYLASYSLPNKNSLSTEMTILLLHELTHSSVKFT